MDKQIEDYLKYLEDFLYNNKDLERLESIADEFNIFTALGIISNEIRHSNFLAWLLNPIESHGFGDYYLKSFLKNVIYKFSNRREAEFTIFEIDGYDLSQAEILKEWRNIDLLIKDDLNRFVCVIENKIYSKEHSNQLNRYEAIINEDYEDFDKIFIYLTVEGEIPSNEVYIPINYQEIIDTIGRLIENKRDKTNDEIISFISHYAEMVNRYIMKESELQKICRNIYKNHKKALDLIFEYKPDQLEEIYHILVRLIQTDNDLILDESSKSYIRFIPTELEFLPKLGNGWTKTKRLLLFEIKNHLQGIDIYLIIGPGDQEIRKRIYDISNSNRPIFNKVTGTFYEKWNTIFKKKLISSNKYEDLTSEEINDIVSEKFILFKERSIKNILEKLSFINENKNGT